MDDRFDFQLVTGEFLDAEGLSYIPNSYHAFGNNGTHVCCNSDLSSGTGASPAVLDALETASDHLPVVADYQLPAWLGASLATTLPSTVPLDSIFNLDVLVENLADVLTENGADELDYAISVSGDLIGTASGMDLALGGGNLHSLLLDTSTLGARSGTVVVSTTSQAAANPLIELPVEFFVGTPSADFDSDGDVDGRDLLAWQRNFGSTGGGDANYDGTVDADDLAVWEMQFGTAPSQGSQQVPEPASLVCFLFALVGSLATRPTRKILR
jgi:hypothetical protein